MNRFIRDIVDHAILILVSAIAGACIGWLIVVTVTRGVRAFGGGQ